MSPLSTACPTKSSAAAQTLGVVSFLNALPLHARLSGREDIRVIPAVPSDLADMLLAGACDAALLPIVDYLKHRDRLAPVGDACIASDGETLTVRVFSKVPAERMTRLYADTDSHTSIKLADVIWRELYGRAVELIPLGNAGQRWDAVESVLMIGDKVVRDAPRGFGFEVDLGAAWKHLTGLPFVFAAWYGRRGADHTRLAKRLDAARDAGIMDAERLAMDACERHGWPSATAVHYLCDIMKYRLTAPMRLAMDKFFSLLAKHGITP